MRWLLAILICSLLGACSSRSPAPVYDRSANPYRRAAESESRIDRPSYYKVRRGDTLYAIAWRYGLDFKALARWNGIAAPYRIFPGQRLELNKPRQMPEEAAEPVETYAVGDQPAAEVATKPTEPKPGPDAGNKAPDPVPGADAGSDSEQRESRPARPVAVSPVSKPAVAGGAIQWRWPAGGPVINAFQAGNASRRGIDISGEPGQPVHAAADGQVVYSGSGLVGYGELVIIKHDERFLSAYGHNRKRLVDEGDRVTAGQTIAEMGQTGNSRPMLHFEIRDNGKPVDPQAHLPRR